MIWPKHQGLQINAVTVSTVFQCDYKYTHILCIGLHVCKFKEPVTNTKSSYRPTHIIESSLRINKCPLYLYLTAKLGLKKAYSHIKLHLDLADHYERIMLKESDQHNDKKSLRYVGRKKNDLCYMNGWLFNISDLRRQCSSSKNICGLVEQILTLLIFC